MCSYNCQDNHNTKNVPFVGNCVLNLLKGCNFKRKLKQCIYHKTIEIHEVDKKYFLCGCWQDRDEKTDLEEEVDIPWKINEKGFDDTCWFRALMSE